MEFIKVPFGYLLDWLYQFTTNYGLSLILFSLFVKLILLPANIKSKKNMLKMSRLAPIAKALEEKYGDDKVKYQQAVSQLYKEEGVSAGGGFDCSGLMYYVFGQFGYKLHRTADDQMDNDGVAVSMRDLQVGDLVFFGSGSYANHVGMYIGNGNFVHAANPSSGVRVSSMNETYYAERYLCARRIA